MSSPFAIPINKLLAGQDALMQMVGNSTVWGFYDSLGTIGWPVLLGQKIGVLLDVNVQVKAINYPASFVYNSPVSRYVSSRGAGAPTLTIMQGGWPGATIGYYIAYPFFPISNPDLLILQDGFNDGSLAARDYPTLINNLQNSWCPGVPIVIDDENTTLNDLQGGHSHDITWNAIVQLLIPGQILPLNPPLQSSTTYSNLWMLDTQQAIIPAEKMGSGVHPSPEGYEIFAEWIFQTCIIPLAIQIPSGSASGSYGWAGSATGHMPVRAWKLTNNAKRKLLNGTFNPSGNFKCALVTAVSNISEASTTWAGVTGEIGHTNNGYTAGGISVPSLVLSGSTSVVCKLGSDLAWLAGSAGLSANKIVLYEVGGDVIGFCPLSMRGDDVTISPANTLFMDANAYPIFSMT